MFHKSAPRAERTRSDDTVAPTAHVVLLEIVPPQQTAPRGVHSGPDSGVPPPLAPPRPAPRRRRRHEPTSSARLSP